jgi:hypothetical protein
MTLAPPLRASWFRYPWLVLTVAAAACNCGTDKLAATRGTLIADPPSVDFGDVSLGDQGVAHVTLRNTGNAVVDVSGVTPAAGAPFGYYQPPASVEGLGASDFTLVFAPTAEGEQTQQFVVTWDGDPGTTTIDVKGNGKKVQQVCGVDLRIPTAVAGPDQTVAPLATVHLNGSSSHSNPPGGTLRYQWRIVSRPPGSGAALTATIPNPSFEADAVGTFVVGLVVTDPNNCSSPESTLNITVMPRGAVHLQLTWTVKHADLDLHYREPGGAWFNMSNSGNDLFYGDYEQRPDWGPGGRADGVADNNPTLDLDDLGEGNLMENTNQEVIFDGTFRVGVNYYCSISKLDYSQLGPAAATLRVFVNHHTTPDFQLTRTLSQRDMWDVADLVVTDNGSSIQVNKVDTVSHTSSDMGGCQ